MTFDETLKIHLDAINNRDLDSLVGTLAADDKLTVILPNGSSMSNFDEVVDFHRQWFSDPDWSLDLQKVSSWQTEHTASVLFNVTYNDLDSTGKAYQLNYLLSLTFIEQKGKWLLVHDQNTMLPDKSS